MQESCPWGRPSNRMQAANCNPLFHSGPQALCRQTLALVPGYTIPWVSNLVTSSFIDASLPTLLFDTVAAVTICSVLEPIYGRLPLAKLVLCAATASGAACFFTMFSYFYALRIGSDLFTERCGFYGVLGALVTALARSKLPALEAQQHGVSLLLPGGYLVLCCAWSFVAGPLNVLPLAVPGTFAGWWYLQYVLKEPPGTPRSRKSTDL